MQTESVRKRTETNGQFEDSFEDLSFRIYEVKSGADELAKYDSSQLTEVAKLPYYLAAREVTKRIRLRPGKYVIIPSLFEKNVNMKFLLRVFYESLDETSRSANESLSGDQNKTKSSDLKLPEKIMLPQNGPATVSSYDVIGKDGDSLKQKTRNVNSEAYESGFRKSSKPVVPAIEKGELVLKNNNNLSNLADVDFNENYNKWFYASLGQNELSTLLKEAAIATSKLSFK